MSETGAREACRETTAHEYRLTIIDRRSLVQRLATELSALALNARQVWPELKNDPIGVGTRFARELKNSVWKSLCEPNRLAAYVTATAIAVMVSLLGFLQQPSRLVEPSEPVEIVELISSPPPARTGAGIGTGSDGRVGVSTGRGEGSNKDPSRARGGGGSGRSEKLAAQKGNLFQPSEIPAALPDNQVTKNPVLPVAGIAIDPKLWKDHDLPQYGDPRSDSVAASRGPGTGGNFGSGNGTGVGEGRGPGFGPGEGGNTGGDKNAPGGSDIGGGSGNNPDDPNRIFRLPEVSQRVRLLSKPEPQYSEEARRAQVTGTVVLRVIFSRSGEVTNIRAVSALPFGLTERAIAAARQIRFLPAVKDNRPVSVYMQLEYNFNLY